MNRVMLIGRLTRDPEVRYTSSNRAVCQFSIAVDRPFTNQQTGQREADFINIVVWDKRAENVGKYMSKGRLVAVEGRIQTRNYENNEGKRVYVTEVVADNVQFLESKNAVANSASVVDESLPNSSKTPYDFADGGSNNSSVEGEDLNDPFASFGESIEISDNDLPF